MCVCVVFDGVVVTLAKESFSFSGKFKTIHTIRSGKM